MRMMQSTEPATARFTRVEWLVIAVACVGFTFDLYETLMMALLVRPAISELGGFKPGTHAFNLWVLLFYVLNVAAGVFGLLGGYFADIFGRKRILVCILLYGLSACAAGFSTSLSQLLFFRCATLIGVSVEFVAATTWLAELFGKPRRRESVLRTRRPFTLSGN